MNDEGNYKELIALVNGLNTKLDLINSNLVNNHNKLEARVDACEDDIEVIKTRPREDKLNVKNEINKTVIHWSIPAVIYLILQAFTSGTLLNLFK